MRHIQLPATAEDCQQHLSRSKLAAAEVPCSPYTTYGPFAVGARSGGLELEALAPRALPKIGLTEQQGFEAADGRQLSPFQTDLSAAGSLDDTTVHAGLAMQSAISNGAETLSNASLHMLDAQVPEMELDSRKGSPCRQAAAELMDTTDPGYGQDDPGFQPVARQSVGSLGLQSSLSQALGDDMLPDGMLRAAQPADCSYGLRNPAEQGSGSGLPQQLPRPAGQQDWIAAMMEQANSVGLWVGSAEERPGQEPPHSGVPQFSESLLAHAPSRGADRRALEENPLEFYESGVAAMLSGKSSQDGRRQLRSEPLAAMPELPGLSAQMPRLPPVSLGMTRLLAQPALSWPQHAAAEGGLQVQNDGPFRPPTRPRDHGTGKAELEMLHPMLQQSKLQLSLGLAADKPLDLKGWGYGSTSTGETLCRPSRAARATESAPATMALKASLPVAHPAASLDSGGPSHVLAGGVALQKPAAQLVRLSSLSTGLQSGSATSFQPKDSLAAAEQRSCVSASHDEGSSSRAECLERYREKKRRRLFSKTIRYHKRKVNADKRPRIKGRFVKAANTESHADDDASASEGHEDS